MERLTNKAQVEILLKKETRNFEENVYLKLAKFENAQEENKLFTKQQLNRAVIKSLESFGEIIKNGITKEILLTLLAEVKMLTDNGKVTYEQVEKTAFEIIRKVAEK